ncbi:hypothetical protein HPB52_022540 [Rhipicephalus sanguineus]|uniref:Transposable element P transposase-like GTP-binding insertion domain-containing protein n=1 Tax=Rhipicephalus sanguineus TaxID=34632 RepID=A0A9D4SZA2_RHISA|nr:hypothetical protein HPB52_022540 [Rhipicephalus sanguineus]
MLGTRLSIKRQQHPTQRRHKHKAGNCEVAYDHYRLLYKAEENQQLRIVPKLTQAHIEPDCLRKMNVRLAAQLFSRGTAIGLEFYRNQGLPGLENSEGTEVFTKELNDLFDVLNAKLPKEGIRPGSSKQKFTVTELSLASSRSRVSTVRK